MKTTFNESKSDLLPDYVLQNEYLYQIALTHGLYKLRDHRSGREVCYMSYDVDKGYFTRISDFVLVPFLHKIGKSASINRGTHVLLLQHMYKEFDKTIECNLDHFSDFEQAFRQLARTFPYSFNGTVSNSYTIWEFLSSDFANMGDSAAEKTTMPIRVSKFKSGDKVMIVTNPDHADHVKKHYGEVLEIDSLLDMGNYTLYKVKGIRDYACEDDLAFILPGENLSLWKTAKKVIEDFALNNHYDSACPPEESLEKEIDGISDIWYYTAEGASECIPYWYVQRLMRAGSAEIVCRVYKESDARLIAIAPELYKTCHELCAHLDYLLRTYSMFIDSYRFDQIKNELKESYTLLEEAFNGSPKVGLRIPDDKILNS